MFLFFYFWFGPDAQILTRAVGVGWDRSQGWGVAGAGSGIKPKRWQRGTYVLGAAKGQWLRVWEEPLLLTEPDSRFASAPGRLWQILPALGGAAGGVSQGAANRDIVGLDGSFIVRG